MFRNGLKLLPLALFCLAASCRPDEKFPDQPKIEFVSFVQMQDSARLTISFTDGDGDVGLDAGDSQPPYDAGSKYYYNLFLTYEELQNGQWIDPIEMLPESLRVYYHYRIPRITPTGQNKVLKGEIAVSLFPFPSGSPNDTSRFFIMMVDRALNESNTVTTGLVIQD